MRQAAHCRPAASSLLPFRFSSVGFPRRKKSLWLPVISLMVTPSDFSVSVGDQRFARWLLIHIGRLRCGCETSSVAIGGSRSSGRQLLGHARDRIFCGLRKEIVRKRKFSFKSIEICLMACYTVLRLSAPRFSLSIRSYILGNKGEKVFATDLPLFCQ